MLDELGPIAAIEWLANGFTSRYGIAVKREIGTGDAHFSPTSTTARFRTGQKALTKVARHADALRVKLSPRADDHHFMLRIADNGEGAQREAGPAARFFGLPGVRERARMLGGVVEIHTAHGEGFILTVTIPAQAAQMQELPT